MWWLYNEYCNSDLWSYWNSNWPSLRLSVTSPFQSWVEPLTRQEVLTFIKLEYGNEADPLQDDEIDLMIVAARAAAEQFQNRDLVRKQWDMSLDYWPSRQIILRDPLVSVDLVQYKASDATVTPLVENTDYIVDAAKQTPLIEPAYSKQWPHFVPWPSSAITIRFTSGYASVADPWWKTTGAVVKRGMLFLIGHWFTNRTAWTRGIGNVEEYPFTVVDCLSSGAQTRARF